MVAFLRTPAFMRAMKRAERLSDGQRAVLVKSLTKEGAEGEMGLFLQSLRRKNAKELGDKRLALGQQRLALGKETFERGEQGLNVRAEARNQQGLDITRSGLQQQYDLLQQRRSYGEGQEKIARGIGYGNVLLGGASGL